MLKMKRIREGEEKHPNPPGGGGERNNRLLQRLSLPDTCHRWSLIATPANQRGHRQKLDACYKYVLLVQVFSRAIFLPLQRTRRDT